MEFFDTYSPLWLAGLVFALLMTGIIAGILAGLLGVGGGIVIVPVLYHLFGLLGIDEAVRMHLAVGTSLATIIPTSIMSARSHRRRGSLDKSVLMSLIPGVLVGVVIGSLLSGIFSGAVLTGVFASVAILVAINMAIPKSKLVLGDRLPGRVGTSLLGTGIGGFSTLMGIGGGTLSVPLLNAFSTPMHVAVGTGAALGMVISIPGALSFLIQGLGTPGLPPGSIGYVNLLGFALIVPATLLTTPYGVRIAHAVNPVRLRQLFALFLALTSARMFYSLLG